MSNEIELTGATLLILLTSHVVMYLIGRFNMTRQEALRNMEQHGHDTSNL